MCLGAVMVSAGAFVVDKHVPAARAKPALAG
jgi:hypothetical protein